MQIHILSESGHVCSNLLDSKCLCATCCCPAISLLLVSDSLAAQQHQCRRLSGWCEFFVPLCLCVITGWRRVIFNLRGGNIYPLVGGEQQPWPSTCLLAFFLRCVSNPRPARLSCNFMRTNSVAGIWSSCSFSVIKIAPFIVFFGKEAVHCPPLSPGLHAPWGLGNRHVWLSAPKQISRIPVSTPAASILT